MEHDLPPPYHAHDPLISTGTWERGSDPTDHDVFHIFCPTNRDYQVQSDRHPKLYVRTHRWNFTKPNLVIYLGSHELDRELGHCEFKEKTGQCDIGILKSPNGESSTMWWSDTDRKIAISKLYRFSAVVHAGNGSDSVYKTFVWKRASRLELVDEATNNVAAIAPEVTFDHPKIGSLEVLVPYGLDFNLIALTTFLSICERLKDEVS